MARSEELIKKIYNAVQEVYDNQVSLEVQKRKIQKEMNPGAFSDFYYGYVKLRTGEVCKRGLETRSYDYFISKIYEEYGKAGLEKAFVFLGANGTFPRVHLLTRAGVSRHPIVFAIFSIFKLLAEASMISL